MARALTAEQRALLRREQLKVCVLATFYLDEGTYRFCDDVMDLSDGTNLYIGASAITDAVDIRSGKDLAAEQVALRCDSNRMEQAGIADPARVLRDIMGYLHQQRRVDLALGFTDIDDATIKLIIPAYAGKINYCRLVDDTFDPMTGDPSSGVLEIVLDSLAARYNRANNRVRSHQDHKNIWPDDDFFSYVNSAVQNEHLLYWGRRAPAGSIGGGGGFATGSGAFMGNGMLGFALRRVMS